MRMRRVTEVLARMGEVVLFLIMLLITVDVIGRYLLKRPIPGAFELTEMMLAFVVFAGVGYVAITKGHISVDFLFSKLPSRWQRAIESVGYLCGGLFFGLMSIQVVRTSWQSWQDKYSTDILHISLSPIQLLVALGLFILCLVWLEMSGHYLRHPERRK